MKNSPRFFPTLCITVSMVVLTCLLQGCLSPAYYRPDLVEPVPGSYKEEGDWKTAVPGDTLDRGNWWERFQDPVLNALVEKAHATNQNIAIAAANFRQARTQIATARADFMPRIEGTGVAERRGVDHGAHTSRYTLGATSTWELSFWNTLPAFEAARAQTEASAADYATMRLAVESELAQSYFQLRALDDQLKLYDDTIRAYEKAVTLTQNQYAAGTVTLADVAQAEAQLAGAQAEQAALERQRSEVEHGVAVLVGQLPTSFRLERGSLASLIPQVPVAVPSVLLERRPDIASAERQVMVANEEIGMARAAWFPSVTLGGSIGLESTAWHGSPLEVWSVGPSLGLSIFEAGKKLAASEAAQAKYEGAVASYRQTVLEAFKDVEDNLAALKHMENEAVARARAVKAANTALRMVTAQYQAGITNYLQVVTSQTTSLANERQAIQVQGQRLIATVALIKALGGGWDSGELAEMRRGVKVPVEGRLP